MIVRKLRLQRGWTQEQLAVLCGLSVRSIQRLERGAPASLETQNALAAVFEVDRSLFSPGEPTMTDQSTETAAEREAIDYVRGVKDFYTHAAMFVVFALIFGLAFGLHRPFIWYGIAGWALGLLVHGLNVFEVISLFGPKWERRQIEKRLGRPL